MGLPARRIDVASRTDSPSVRLRVIDGVEPSARRRQVASRAGGLGLAALFVAVVAAGFASGLLRVHLAAQAAQASEDAVRLREAIAEARFEGESLEVRLSALEDPERIRVIAGADMVPVTVEPSVLELPSQPVDVASSDAETQGGKRSLLTALLGATGSEADALLVGDVGLVSLGR